MIHFIFDFVDTFRVDIILDVEERHHREVRPFVDTAFLVYRHIFAVVYIKAISFVKVVLPLVVLSLGRFLTRLAFRIHRLLPKPFPLVEFAEFPDIHLNPRLVIDEREKVRDAFHRLPLLLRRVRKRE